MKLLIVLLVVLVVLLLVHCLWNRYSDIAVVMWYDDAIKDYADLTYNINKKYCDKHKIPLYKSDKICVEGRDPTWQKVCWLLHLMNTTSHEYFFWIDADAVFNQMDVPIDAYIKPGYDLMISIDLGRPNYVNAGVFIIKNTPETRRFIKLILESEATMCRDRYKTHFHEQDCMNHHLPTEPIKTYKYDLGTFQSFDPKNRKAFVTHLAGTSRDDRLKYFSSL